MGDMKFTCSIRHMKTKSHQHLAAIASLCFPAAQALATTQTLFPAGTPLSSTNNYMWWRMTTINVDSGQWVPFVTYAFNTLGGTRGDYTFTMNTVGFGGAI